MGLRIDQNARFERQKELAKQEQNAQKQVAQDAMARRFAAMGRQNSGAAIKNQQLVERDSNEALNKRLQGIQDTQDAETQRLQEIEDARKFATSEREAGQKFGAEQAELGRKFQTGERLGGQEFAAAQADIQRKYGTSEREAQQKFAYDRQEAAEDFQIGQDRVQRAWQQQYVLAPQQAQFAQQFEMANRQFDLDKLVTEFNMGMSKDALKDQNRSMWQKIWDPMNLFGRDAGKLPGVGTKI